MGEIDMCKKVLFCATVDVHFKAFHLPYLKWFKEQGWEVHVAASGDITLPFVDRKFNIPIQRSPFNKRNLQAYKEIKKVIKENHYKIIHCHTPMGGVLIRLAAREAKKHGTKVIYTAHGFHFCKGSPIFNWILYYPIEKVLSKFTDCLITINQEDFTLAKERKFKADVIKHVHGVGVNTEVYKPIDISRKNLLRKIYGYKPEDFLMIYAAEFNKNKNQKLLIESLAYLKEEVPNVKLLLAGDGPLLQKCKNHAHQLGVNGMIHFLGYRSDMELLLKMSDIAVGSSLREGLPVNIMEAMACGLPVVANNNRGHRELIKNDKNGWISTNDPSDFSKKVKRLAVNYSLRKEMGIQGRNLIVSQYSIQKIIEEKSDIYKLYMEELEGVQCAVH